MVAVRFFAIIAAMVGSAVARADALPSAPEACRSDGSVFSRQPRHCLSEIETDRPHRTDTPATVPAGYFQSEIGLAMYEPRSGSAPATLHLFDALLKVGVSERVDVQIGYSPLALRQRGDRAGWLGAGDLAVGRSLFFRSKIRLMAGSSIQLTVAPSLSIPLDNQAGVEGGGTLLLGADLARWLSWEANLSLFFEQQETDDRRVAHLVPCTAFTARLVGPFKAFGEIYLERPMAAQDAGWTGTLDSGVLWLITNDVQLDLALYIGLTPAVPAYTAASGLSWRF
jgi:hypothetical protein